MRGEPVDRPPNFDIMMTLAAHFIGRPLSEFCLDYRVLCDANLAVREAFDLDIVAGMSDPYWEAADFGSEIDFPEDSQPLCRKPLLGEPEDLGRLARPDPYTGRRMSNRLEAMRCYREEVGGEVPIMGWVEGAVAQASVLRGLQTFLLDFYDRPEWIEDLLEHCVEVEIAFAKAQIEAGADIIGLGDAAASLLSPPQYRRFALPYEQRIFEAVHEMGGIARLHICGNTSHLLSDMARSGADIIDLDWMVDMAAAARIFAGGPAPCGNFNPTAVMLQGTPEGVRDAAIEALEKGGSRCISAAGCEIPDGTPHANLYAQRDALREFGGRA